jgi:two-component system, NarL family, response regulator NreC
MMEENRMPADLFHKLIFPEIPPILLSPKGRRLLNMDVKKRILIVDDHPNLREGLKSILSLSPIFDVVGEASDGLEALFFVEKLIPDLVLMDLSMPRMDGITATREIKKKWPGTKILIFTVHNTAEYQTAAMKAGADGYLLKGSSSAKMTQSIKDILEGKHGFLTNIME